MCRKSCTHVGLEIRWAPFFLPQHSTYVVDLKAYVLYSINDIGPIDLAHHRLDIERLGRVVQDRPLCSVGPSI
jgi:hypothetical protein